MRIGSLAFYPESLLSQAFQGRLRSYFLGAFVGPLIRSSKLGFESLLDGAVDDRLNPLRPLWDRYFLARRFHKGLFYSTICGYRSAIVSNHIGFRDKKVGGHPLFTKLLKGMFLQRTPRRNVALEWSLEVVLRALKEAPFELLALVSMKCFTLKTVFL